MREGRPRSGLCLPAVPWALVSAWCSLSAPTFAQPAASAGPTPDAPAPAASSAAPTPATPAESATQALPADPVPSPAGLCVARHAEGQEAQLDERFRDAVAAFTACADPICPALVRSDCMQWGARVNASMPRVLFEATPGTDAAEVRISIDGEAVVVPFGEALAFDPGTLSLRFEAPGRAPVTRTLSLRAGDATTVVRVELPELQGEDAPGVASAPPLGPADALPHTPSADLPTSRDANVAPALVYVFGGLALAAVGVGSYFALDGAHDKAEAESSCAPLCSADVVDSVDRKLLIADVSFGVGVLSAGAALVLYWIAGEDAEAARPLANVSMSVAPDASALSLRGRF